MLPEMLALAAEVFAADPAHVASTDRAAEMASTAAVASTSPRRASASVEMPAPPTAMAATARARLCQGKQMALAFLVCARDRNGKKGHRGRLPEGW